MRKEKIPLDKVCMRHVIIFSIMTDTENQTLTPPYISISKMQKVFDLLSNRSFSTLSTEDFINRGLSKAEAFQALQALRFFGLMDSEGRLKDLKFLALRGEARTQGLKDTITNAYSKLFGRTENPAALSRDELYNEFIAEYGLSPRLTQGALPLFLWLSKEAGFVVSQQVEPRQRASSSKAKSSTPVHSKSSHDSSQDKASDQAEEQFHKYQISKIVLMVPRNETTDLLIAKGGLVDITQKIEEFAKKANLVRSEEAQESSTDNDAG